MFASGRTYTSPPAAGEQRIVRKPNIARDHRSSIIDHQSHSHPDVGSSRTVAHLHRLDPVATLIGGVLLTQRFPCHCYLMRFLPVSSVGGSHSKLNGMTLQCFSQLIAGGKITQGEDGDSTDELRSVRRKISWSHILVKKGSIAICQMVER